MSVESISIALHHSRATGAAKLVLIGIANHDGDGGAWPSVATLSRYAGVDRRNVQRAVRKLEELHEIRAKIQRGGDSSTADARRPNLYDFVLRCPPDCDGSRHHRTRVSRTGQTEIEELSTRAATAPPGGDSARGGAATAPPEPSYNQPSTTSHKSTHVGNRARGACGHDLIDDRHCSRGCRAADVEGAAA
ncbi:MAG TPA: helix-turn-helix domain-containing protein [Microbacterium sp.]|nr:helix-turn-helix domain-containing protein [Microbacterium sp.]